MRRWAPRWGLIDQPAARKVHSTPTPLGGGVGIYCGFVIPIVAAYSAILLLPRDTLTSALPLGWEEHVAGALSRGPQLAAILGAGTLLAVMGLIDDVKGLPWQPRLAVQLGIAIALALAGVRATVFVEAEWVGMLATVIWIVVLVNAFNFLDNMDGLSAGIGLIAAVVFASIMLSFSGSPRWLVGGSLLVLAGSLAGFLVHNRPPAKIFMGDAGSTFLGLTLACLTLVGTFYDPQQAGRHVMLAPICVLAVPLFDLTTVVFIRLKEGRSPFHPDKNHFSHRLVELGLSRYHAVLTVHLVTLTTGLAALLIYEMSSLSRTALVAALVLCVLTVITVLETVGRRRNGDA
ncbi:MAG: undecaprenyl/decaprenyl-phosphate alpha-N-acetylglucosaminyl 1-phosphate transferase [Planctomycetota bacterium]|nr:MAG: undecaprenyl/decaprenyl-phosphate alpha-N-acetylglucosaminyl 1-phosphate transferase [Planctomycetota bacterium]REJ93455.1 MAG: undecaprenyl/decaprenyl-phosphate alpha-N-acetylglucosaminyl 1-phosphate transferase [Planctomycetota bacterium]REK20039.1 MAG: undecaprenyl/decaprenyl-phosphate alpha-N-acetylglucosaminyl 1-phosphate transferase [Planctomycetota bacterium]REK27603.1 MAG: undecaprenyl/decaprenyl-phosphate alpha-N-acetylglucosaminyl 1-phosphate transferase [Planctomycetota bacter